MWKYLIAYVVLDVLILIVALLSTLGCPQTQTSHVMGNARGI